MFWILYSAQLFHYYIPWPVVQPFFWLRVSEAFQPGCVGQRCGSIRCRKPGHTIEPQVTGTDVFQKSWRRWRWCYCCEFPCNWFVCSLKYTCHVSVCRCTQAKNSLLLVRKVYNQSLPSIHILILVCTGSLEVGECITLPIHCNIGYMYVFHISSRWNGGSIQPHGLQSWRWQTPSLSW